MKDTEKKEKKAAVPSKIKERGTDRAFNIFIYVFSALIILIVVYPLIFVLSASFSSPSEIIRGNVIFWPKGLNLDSYKAIISNSRILRGYGNTVFISVVGTAINIAMTTMCAFPLSNKKLAGRNVLTIFITFTMFFNAGMIPNYLLMKDLKLLNSYMVLMLPGAISVYNMLVMRNYFQSSIPGELIEAARMDGCGNLRTLFKIVLPLSKAIMAVMLIFYVAGHWNAYFSAMMYITDKDKYPLQLVLREILIQASSYTEEGLGQGFSVVDASLKEVGIQYATIVVSSIPVMLLYPLMQKYFVKGVMIGAVKG
ncbi:MAG: carbohydrate ABC transporter permease [Lachnospiraceae bacterium]|nr:carbohydrate ABC transporter permease [Lachnospiraceae bacterium]MBP5653862.1 carbohydrate ABC transporter permease [Lachnospiraceae bacterium]